MKWFLTFNQTICQMRLLSKGIFFIDLLQIIIRKLFVSMAPVSILAFWCFVRNQFKHLECPSTSYSNRNHHQFEWIIQWTEWISSSTKSWFCVRLLALNSKSIVAMPWMKLQIQMKLFYADLNRIVLKATLLLLLLIYWLYIPTIHSIFISHQRCHWCITEIILMWAYIKNTIHIGMYVVHFLTVMNKNWNTATKKTHTQHYDKFVLSLISMHTCHRIGEHIIAWLFYTYEHVRIVTQLYIVA